jgi:hypothetical protein
MQFQDYLDLLKVVAFFAIIGGSAFVGIKLAHRMNVGKHRNTYGFIPDSTGYDADEAKIVDQKLYELESVVDNLTRQLQSYRRKFRHGEIDKSELKQIAKELAAAKSEFEMAQSLAKSADKGTLVFRFKSKEDQDRIRNRIYGMSR